METDTITISVEEYKELLELKVGPGAYRRAARLELREGACQAAVREAVDSAFTAKVTSINYSTRTPR